MLISVHSSNSKYNKSSFKTYLNCSLINAANRSDIICVTLFYLGEGLTILKNKSINQRLLQHFVTCGVEYLKKMMYYFCLFICLSVLKKSF